MDEPHAASALLELLQVRQSNAQNVTVKFEGRGLGIAGACAIACVCAVLFLGGIVAYLGYKVENQQMQLNAVYMMAPHLKPETTK
jgi:K+-transporting ATPase A subunit